MPKRALCIATFGLLASVSACQRSAPDLTIAIDEGDVARVKAALEAGADANAYRDRWAPLLRITDNAATGDVSTANRVAIAKLLLARGADPNARISASPDGFAPLHFAAAYGLDEIGELLIRSGAKVDPPRADGGPTPLWLAAVAHNVGMVKCLLKHGADPNARNHRALETKGMTSLHVAAAGRPHVSADLKTTTYESTPEQLEIIRALLEAGADPAATDAQGRTPLALAETNGQTKAAEMLRSSIRPK